MTRSHRNRRLLLGLLAGLLILQAAPNGVDAQEPPEASPPEAPPPAETPAPPPVIPLSEIPGKAEAEDRRLREIAELLEPSAEIEKLRESFAELRGLLAPQQESLEELLAGAPSRQRLADASTEWARFATQLDKWQQLLTQRTEALGGTVKSIEEDEALWKRSREEAGRDAPPAVRTRMDALLKQIADTTRDAKRRRSEVLTLLDEITQAQATTARAAARIEQAQRELRGRLFEPDSEPLWQALPMLSQQLGSRTSEAQANLRREFATAGSFIESQRSLILLHLSVFAVLLYYGFVLRRRVAGWGEEDPDLGHAIHMLRRPISTSALLALALTKWLYPLAPQIVFDLLAAVLLVPLLRLLPPLFPRAFRPLLWALALLYLVSTFRTLVDAAPLVERAFFVLEISGGLAFLVWLLRPSRLLELPLRQVPPRALGVGLRAAALLMLASLMANVLGYTSFSRLLGNGVLVSAYLALLLYAVYRAIEVAMRVSFNSRRAQTLGVVRRRGHLLLRWGNRVLGLALLLAWAYTALEQFSILDPALAAFATVMDTSLRVGALDVGIGDVLAFALTLGAAYLVSSLIRFVLEEDLFPRVSMQRGLPNAIATLMHYVVLSVGFILALAAAGMDFSRVTLLAGAFSVGVGFGLQNVVNNFVSGLILLFERPIQVGDAVEVGGVLGEVRRIGIRSSTVRTVDGAEVIVPNANLISEQVVNWTLSDRKRRIEVAVGVAYGTDPTRVQALLLETSAANETVLDDPEPLALFMGFGDSSLDFLLRAWIPRFEEGFTTRSALAVDIYARLNAAGIEVPFPQRDLHLRSVDSEAGRALQPTASEERPVVATDSDPRDPPTR